MSKRTKLLLMEICRLINYTGLGNYWNGGSGKNCYLTISLCAYVIMVLLENLAACFGDFPKVEKNSAVMFSVIHNTVLVKMFLLLYYKKSIRKLNNEMAELGADMEDDVTMNNQHKKIKYGLLLYIVSVYLSLLAYGVDSLRKSVTEVLIIILFSGTPFYTVVTYYPGYDSTTYVASVLRVFFYMTWLYMMLPMMAADCLPIVHLIVMAYKFITLCNHFKKISKEFSRDKTNMRKESAILKLKFGCMQGILMHQKLILLIKEVNRVFGMIMSLQVCESSAVAVLLLLRLAISPRQNVTDAIMTYTFVSSLFILLALNLWNAGEITYQASLLSFDIYSCGWHLCDSFPQHQKDIKYLVLISTAQAQKSLILKAFAIQELSYATFVSVARLTYSIFAVFYK
nr:odorant receptor 12 [Papilio memnon]